MSEDRVKHVVELGMEFAFVMVVKFEEVVTVNVKWFATRVW
jgi:hypothetical protein